MQKIFFLYNTVLIMTKLKIIMFLDNNRKILNKTD